MNQQIAVKPGRTSILDPLSWARHSSVRAASTDPIAVDDPLDTKGLVDIDVLRRELARMKDNRIDPATRG